MEFFIIIISICIVALFTFSITYINLLNIKKLDHESKYVKEILKNPGKYIIRAELAITTLEFLIGGMAVEAYAIPLLVNLAEHSNISFFIIKYLAIVIVTIISAYITTIFGKYIPKHLALKNHKEKNSFTILFFSIISVILLPFTMIANIFDGLTKKFFKTDKNYQENEILEFTNIEYEKGIIKKYEKDLINRTIKLNDIRIDDIYKKIDNVISIEINSNFNDILSVFKQHEYSRLPVYKDSKDNIVGVLYIKDVLYNIKEIENGTLHIKEIIRMPLYEYKNILLSTILRKMKSSKIHMAVIIKKDVTVGIITYEDIIEKILGNTKDEFKN